MKSTNKIPKQILLELDKFKKQNLKNDTIHVFTDASSGKLYSGVGIYISYNQESQYFFDFEQDINKTNNYLELYAIKSALEILHMSGKSNQKIVIYSDSQYSLNSIFVWSEKWKHNNWKLKKNKLIKNLELIQSAYFLRKKFKNLKHKWVRGHDGNYGNEVADLLSRI